MTPRARSNLFALALLVLPLPVSSSAAAPTPRPAAGAPPPAASGSGDGAGQPSFGASSPSATDTLTLAGAVRTALELDPDVAGAEAAADAAAAGVQVARAARFPSLSTSAEAVRFEEPMIVAPIHAFDLSRAPEFDRTLLRGRLELGYTLWDGGGRGARIGGARAVGAARVAAVSAQRQDAIHGLVEAYLSVLTARDVVAAGTARRGELEAERDRVRRFLEEGTVPRLEVLRAEAELSAAAADVAAARAGLEVAESELASLLDLTPAEVAVMGLVDVEVAGAEGSGEPSEADLTADRPPAPDAPAATSPAQEDPDRHPALAAARARLEAARAAARQRRAAWFPALQASGGFVEYGGASAGFTGEWQAGLRLEYPLFTGGARSGEMERAQAEVRAAEAEVRRIRRELRRAVDAARSAERAARARVTSLADAVGSFEELARVEALALDEGVGVQRDFLRAQAGLLGARAGLAEARREVVLARVRLARALGLLSPEWIERTLEPTP